MRLPCASIRGEIHGLIGENGAGKSTLIKILAGVYQADSGSATLDGHPLPLGNPAAIEAAGIRVIHQELNLIPHFTVAESVFLGQEYRTRWGALDHRRMKAATAQFFQQNWQLAIDPERLVRDLSLAERKLVQIARALIDGAARLVVFDEPTAPPGGAGGQSGLLRYPAPARPGHCHSVYFPLPQ